MMKRVVLCISFLFITFLNFTQMDDIVEKEFRAPESNLWMGSYNQFRITDKIYWMAEFHYRRGNNENVPFLGKMSQIYNRHAINYFFSPSFNMSLGGVLRLDFTPDPGNPEFEPLIYEPRIWHEYLFAIPLANIRIYHRIRLEHRWSRSNLLDNNDWIFRNRWRYKFYAKIPLNKKKLGPGTIYLNPEVEIILQSGKNVKGSHIEDLRISPLLSYIYNSKITYSTGLMYTMGQNLNNSMVYRQRFIYHFKCYISLDFRKETKKIPKVNILD